MNIVSHLSFQNVAFLDTLKIFTCSLNLLEFDLLPVQLINNLEQ